MLGRPIKLALASLLTAILAQAQSPRSYSTAHAWWDAGRGVVFPVSEDYDNPTGEHSVLLSAGAIRPEGHPFFEALGKNGRACITCHQPANAMSLSAATARERWEGTNGKDPLFAAVDGSNCPDAPQSERASHSLLLDHGLIRIPLPWPPRAVEPEFTIEVVRDPSGCNLSLKYGLGSAAPTVSVFRRPRVVGNFGAANTTGSRLMADGREPSLRSQAIAAAFAHEQAEEHPSEATLAQILDFENRVFVAQTSDLRGGRLSPKNGPSLLGTDNLAYREAALFNGTVTPLEPFATFELWKLPKPSGLQEEFRASAARGSEIFAADCAACHLSNSNRAISNRAMDTGTANTRHPDEPSDLPLFRILRNGTDEAIYTHDPGVALITGKWADVGTIVMQQLRGLSARAPYFSNGSAETLGAVVDFYDRRFGSNYSKRERDDLINFLATL